MNVILISIVPRRDRHRRRLGHRVARKSCGIRGGLARGRRREAPLNRTRSRPITRRTRQCGALANIFEMCTQKNPHTGGATPRSAAILHGQQDSKDRRTRQPSTKISSYVDIFVARILICGMILDLVKNRLFADQACVV